MPKPNFWPTPPRKVGNRYEYGSLTFWAEGGGIYLDDADPKPGERTDRKNIMLPSWKARLESQCQLLAHAEKDRHIGHPAEIAWKAQYCRAVKALIEAMYDVGRQAAFQGDLTRPEVQRYYREHVASVKQTHLVPGVILPH